MGNRNSVGVQKESEEEENPRKIVIHDEIALKQKSRTRCVLIIAMCCSTVINTVEPEHQHNDQDIHITNISANTNHVSSSEVVAPPKKPLNSKPRVRRYGYSFTARVDPLILSPDDLEELSIVGQEINKTVEIENKDVHVPILAQDTDDDYEFIDEPFDIEKLRQQIREERREREEVRHRARSAVMNNVKKNELQRRKMNEWRLLQAKQKREDEKLRLKNMSNLNP